MPETQKPLTPPRINDINKVLRELRGNQTHLPTHMVSLTEERYFPTEATEKVKNIATLMDITMDEDFPERCLNAKMYPFYISSKDIPQELIAALARLSADGQFIHFKIDREKRTLNLIPESQYDGLNFNEKGRLHRSVLKGINEGGLLHIGFYRTVLWVSDPSYFGTEVSRLIAVVKSTD